MSTGKYSMQTITDDPEYEWPEGKTQMTLALYSDALRTSACGKCRFESSLSKGQKLD
jgi:hypothetical protein